LPKFLINWQNQLITLLNYPALKRTNPTCGGGFLSVGGSGPPLCLYKIAVLFGNPHGKNQLFRHVFATIHQRYLNSDFKCIMVRKVIQSILHCRLTVRSEDKTFWSLLLASMSVITMATRTLSISSRCRLVIVSPNAITKFVVVRCLVNSQQLICKADTLLTVGL